MRSIAICVAAWTLLAIGAAAQNQYYVSNSIGNDANPPASVLNSGGATAWKTIQHGIGAVALGGSGTTLHVAAGSYSTTASTCGIASNFCVNFDGTASARFVVKCDDPVTGCKVTGTPAGGYDVIVKANFVDLVGFEVGPCSGCNAGIAILGGTNFSNKGTSVHILGNYVHDIAQSGNDGNGFGNGCPSSGMIIADFKGQNIPDLQVIGNRVNVGGLMSLGNACNQFHGLYVNGATLVQDNLISNVVGEGINFGPSPCKGTVTNNTVFHNGQRGILIASYSGDNCASNGGDGHMTVNNNASVNNGVNNSSIGNGIGESGSVGTNNLYSNDLLQGNAAGDGVAVQTNPSSSIVNLRHEATGTTFNGYNNSGLGDYTLRTGSVAISGGTAGGVAGGTPPFSPLTDFAGNAMSSPPSIGAFTSGGGASLPAAQASPSPVAFAATAVTTPASCAAILTTTLTNTGTANMTLGSPIVTITPNQFDFQFGNIGTCTNGQVLTPGASCKVSGAFCPSTAGPRTAQFNIFSNAPGSPLVVPLTGTGIAPLPPINLVVTVQ